MKRNQSPHPAWALACKRKGTELRRINGKYYLYEVSSKWNAEKKRSIKISGKILGKITEEEGFVESDKARLRKQQMKIERIETKEYGVTALINSLFCDTVEPVKKYFPDRWRQIVCLAYGRLVYQSPLKNMFFHYSHSYLSELYPDLRLSPAQTGQFLNELGGDRSLIVEYFRSFNMAGDKILFDGTDLFSHSALMGLPKFSRSKFGTYDDTINLMCLFSVSQQMPLYYRILAGNIKDMNAFGLSLVESGAQDAIAIIDKGFSSEKNISLLEATENMRFIIPLRRNSSLIDYEKAKKRDKSLYDGYFVYQKRHIWHYSYNVSENRRITVFIDDAAGAKETEDYLVRIDGGAEGYTIEKFFEKAHTFGTIAMIDDTDRTNDEVYNFYKTRGEVETMIDALKNIIDADSTYMQNEQTLEGWMFINILALKWYYSILNLLKQHDLNKSTSPRDFLQMLSEIRKVKINGTWHDTEMVGKTRDLLTKLKIFPVT